MQPAEPSRTPAHRYTKNNQEHQVQPRKNNQPVTPHHRDSQLLYDRKQKYTSALSVCVSVFGVCECVNICVCVSVWWSVSVCVCVCVCVWVCVLVCEFTQSDLYWGSMN